MPIHHALELNDITDSEFAEIDAVVMRCAYAVQNHFGRLFDERVYENDLAARLRAEGFTVYTQMPVKVSHCGFEKTYFLDLVVNEMLYELKVVSALLREHDAQALNYAMLQNIRLVKLINFGEEKVRGKLLRNALSEAERHRSTQQRDNFVPLGPRCRELIEYLELLILDLGTHLDSRLYNAALIHHFGGDLHCLQRVPVTSGDLLLGTHAIPQHDLHLGFAVTGFSKPSISFHRHLQVLLEHVRTLNGIQWINLNHSCLEVTTIAR